MPGKRGRPPNVRRQPIQAALPVRTLASTPVTSNRSRGEGRDPIPCGVRSGAINNPDSAATPTQVNRATISPALLTLVAMQQVTEENIPVISEGVSSTPNQADNQSITRRLVAEHPPVEQTVQHPAIEALEVIPEEQPEIRPEIDLEDNKEEAPEKETYADILRGNRLAGNGFDLSYTVPTVDDSGICISFSDDEIGEEVQKWQNSLVFYIVGAEHTLAYMEQYIEKIWGEMVVPVLHQHDNGFFVARFENEEDCDLVFSSGPYTVKSQPMILKKWYVDFDFKHEKLTKLALWVKLPNLPLPYWGRNSLGKIVSAVGKPLRTDERTVNQKKVAFARAMVEVDISQPLVKEVKISPPTGEPFMQQIKYEWIPVFCQKCQVLGHRCHPTPRWGNERVQVEKDRRQNIPQRNRRNRNQQQEWIVVRNENANRNPPRVPRQIPPAPVQQVAHVNQFTALNESNEVIEGIVEDATD
ncbi:hypothetical protein OROMI_003842 [Orobanche minor]